LQADKNILLSVEDKMKSIKIIIVFLLVIFVQTNAHAARCGVENAKVADVLQWEDGTIFIEFDTATNCNVSIPSRLAFSDHNQKFFMAAALTALTTGKTVTAYGEDINLVHGNTATLTAFQIRRD
jgi:hypothetical protein